jgi:hypothetical protein
VGFLHESLPTTRISLRKCSTRIEKKQLGEALATDVALRLQGLAISEEIARLEEPYVPHAPVLIGKPSHSVRRSLALSMMPGQKRIPMESASRIATKVKAPFWSQCGRSRGVTWTWYFGSKMFHWIGGLLELCSRLGESCDVSLVIGRVETKNARSVKVALWSQNQDLVLWA